MKKRTKVLLGICIPLILVTGGVIMTQKTPFDIFLTHDFTKPSKTEEIAYLKKYEQKMTDFVKKQNSKVTSVQWNWDSVEIEEIQPNAGGIPTGDGYKVLRIAGKVNNVEDSGTGLIWQLPKNSYYPKIGDMYLWGQIELGGKQDE